MAIIRGIHIFAQFEEYVNGDFKIRNAFQSDPEGVFSCLLASTVMDGWAEKGALWLEQQTAILIASKEDVSMLVSADSVDAPSEVCI